jgi:hypothetical protein
LRQIGLVIGMFTVIIGFASGRDLAGLIAYIRTDDFVLALGSLLGLWSFGYGQYRSWQKKHVEIEIARAAPNAIVATPSQAKAQGLQSAPLAALGALAIALLLAACATVGGPETPAQKLYAAQAAYSVAVQAAADYAEGPTADASVVAALNSSNKAVRPAVEYARAYMLCGGSNDSDIVTSGSVAIDCALFDFRPTTVTDYAIVIRSAAIGLLARLAR